MQIKKRIFSYPILTNNKFYTTYNNEFISLEFDDSEDDHNYYLNNLHFECNSNYFLEKWKEDIIAIKCVIECSVTIYKKIIDISLDPINITIPKNNLDDKFEISLIAYVKDKTIFESTKEFDEDYQDLNYNFDLGQIVAYDDGYTQTMIHHENSDSLVESIFSIIRNETSESKNYEVQIKTKKIEISLSKELHAKYQKVYAIDDFTEEFFCALLVPALAEGLYKCLEYAKGKEDIDYVIDQYNWFYSIKDAYLRLNGKELTLEEFQNISIISLAQQLLGSPIEKALDSIILKVKQGDDLDD